MLYDVFLVSKRSGLTHAHVPDLPGCNWRAATPRQAGERAPAALAEHLAWLRRHGLAAPPLQEEAVPHLVQCKSTGRSGGIIGFFESERVAVTAEETPGLLALMACARADLLALTRELPPDALDRRPAPKSWCILEVLRHVADAERWYLTRILDPASLPRFGPQRDIWRRLEAVRALAVERLQGLSEVERMALVVADDGEQWTARKVFRRFVEHEREHHAHVVEILEAIGLSA